MKLDLTLSDVIENRGGQLSSLRGPKATEAFRLRTILVGLQLEERTGGRMRLTRGVNCRKLAKQETKLKTNDYAKLIDRIGVMLMAKVNECLVVDEEDYNTGA